MDPLPDDRLTPRLSAEMAVAVFGRATVVGWAEDLLSGRVSAGDTAHPDIRWLLPDDEGRVDALVDDPIERVRAQAWRALGRKDPS